MAKSAGGKTAHRGSRWWIWVVVGILAVGALVLGYRGLGSRQPSNRLASGNPAPIHEPVLPASGFSWKYQAYALKTGHPAYLVRGSRVTVVMLMASWCLYCAYVDKYVWPTVLHTPGLSLNLVDVSPNGGIGDPGPKNPPFSGHDNETGAINVAGMRTVMSQYIARFHLTAPNVHVYVDPQGLSYWNVQDFPTILIINAQGQVTRINGAITVSTARAEIAKALKSS